MKCTPDTPHDHVAAAMGTCQGCGHPVVILRQHGGRADGTTLVATLTDESLVDLCEAVIAVVYSRGLGQKLRDALRNPADRIRFEDRREEP